jgi:Protein of unknown function (DUF1194)
LPERLKLISSICLAEPYDPKLNRQSAVMNHGVINRRQVLASFACGISVVPARALETEVDLALVLAIDCSYSVSTEEYRLQMQGMGRAFMNPQVFEAIETGPNKRIAVSAFLWSEDKSQHLIQPWKIISTRQQAFSLGNHLLYTARDLAEGGTSISAAMLYAQNLFAFAPAALRRVVDVSTDGRNNSGPSTKRVRDRLVADGITINALAIVNEVKTLAIYLENEVASGEGSFVLKAYAYEVYGEAILKKLVKEIVGPGIS